MTFREWLDGEMMNLHGPELRLINRIREEFDRRFTKKFDSIDRDGHRWLSWTEQEESTRRICLEAARGERTDG